MNVLKIATFNTWNCQGDLSARLPLMRAQLNALDADVILLQEVFAEAPSGFDVAQDLAVSLDMAQVYAPARKKLRKFADCPVLCHSGLAILTRGRIEDHKVLQLPHDDRDGERLGLIARLDVLGRTVVVGNVHLTHLPGENGLREIQLSALAESMGHDAYADLFVIGGDMNLVSGCRVLQDFSQNWAYQKIRLDVDEASVSTLNPVNGTAVATGVIDHLFVKGGGAPLGSVRAEIALDDRDGDGVFPSDHKAVLARVELGD